MNEKILICVAWPYANGSLHIGQTAGAYIPADIFARYHRAKGNDVLMVTGSDSHGTPVTLTAEDLGISPKEVFAKSTNEIKGLATSLFILSPATDPPRTRSASVV